jgi:uncharacterized Zn finger protein
LTCTQCGSDKLFFVLGGDKAMIACKECTHIEQKVLTPEVKGEIEKMMQGNVPWKKGE